MCLKKKLVTAVVCFIAAMLLNVYLSTVIFQIVGRSFDGFSGISFFGGLNSIFENGTHGTIFVCIQIFVTLGLILLIASRITSYESAMTKITDDIKTPAVAGQKQHGSARWQTKDEIFKNFDVVRFEKENPIIKDLIEHGYDDLDFYRNEKKG